MKSRLILAVLSGGLLLGGVACGGSSSNASATCLEWRTNYTTKIVPGPKAQNEADYYNHPEIYGSRTERVPSGQTCVRTSGDVTTTTMKRVAVFTTPTTATTVERHQYCDGIYTDQVPDGSSQPPAPYRTWDEYYKAVCPAGIRYDLPAD